MDSGYGYYYSPTFFVAFTLIFLIIGIVLIVADWKIYTKAGYEGWKSIIPIYNTYILYEIAFGMGNGMSWFAAWLISSVLSFIPFVFIIPFAINIIVYYRLSKCFGKGIGFFIGMLLLPVVFLPILAFGDTTYEDPE